MDVPTDKLFIKTILSGWFVSCYVVVTAVAKETFKKILQYLPQKAAVLKVRGAVEPSASLFDNTML